MALLWRRFRMFPAEVSPWKKQYGRPIGSPDNKNFQIFLHEIRVAFFERD